MKHRVVLALAVGGAPLAVIGACTFPDVTFGPASDASSPDSLGTLGSEAGTGTPSGGGKTDAAAFLVDGEVPDVVSARPDGTERIEDASICETRPRCDCDLDGFLDKGCVGGPPGWDGGDCDDHDGLRHPGQDWVTIPPPPGLDGDWNCDGIVDKGFNHDNGGTKWCSGLSAAGCAGGLGYDGDPGCGVDASLNTCAAAGGLNLNCSLHYEGDSKPQACK